MEKPVESGQLNRGTLKPQMQPEATFRPKRVVVLGSGFGATAFLKSFVKRLPESLRGSVYILVVARRRSHVFTPLLYQVATGLVDVHHIVQPISTKGFAFIEAEVTAISLQDRRVETTSGTVPYDYLVMALGSVPHDFGVPGVLEYACTLKSPADAERIRNRIVESFEQASQTHGDDVKRRSYLTFVVVGGGATGVELAGSIRDYVGLLCKNYGINRHEARVVLLEAADQLLPGMNPSFADKCRRDLASAGISVLLHSKVVRVQHDSVELSDGSKIPTYNVFWAAGVKPSPLTDVMGVEKIRGRVAVDGFLRLPNHPEVYVLGDSAWVGGASTIVPQTASAAVQEGKYVGRRLAAVLGGSEEPQATFKYRDRGTMLSLGRFSGLSQLGGVTLSGFFWVAGMEGGSLDGDSHCEEQTGGALRLDFLAATQKDSGSHRLGGPQDTVNASLGATHPLSTVAQLGGRWH